MGTGLFRDAILRTVAAAAILGIRGRLAHAISEDARAFYERHGFVASPTQPMTLMLPFSLRSRRWIVRRVHSRPG
ncbi:MAG: hypothetical protein KC442_05775 [Thermomicrobiales bacterium]|nr:hypothetical protein [Thermomicrobiales bacterium]